jgi:colanic acid/amylovoran biosynthesis glycosyltransferase
MNVTGEPKPVVAHVNYLFFHSTQSFIYFYLAACRRTRPICLTRAPEARADEDTILPRLARDYYLYRGRAGTRRTAGAVWSLGPAVRHGLTRLPPALADPVLGALQRSVVPRVRPDIDPGHFLRWAETIVLERDARIIHAYFGPVAWRMIALKEKLGLPLVVTFLGDDIAPTLSPWWSWWYATGREAPDWPARLRELLDAADLVLAEGPFIAGRLVELGCAPEKVAVQRMALPVSEILVRDREGGDGGRTVILFAGRFTAQKGLLYAIEAVRELRQERDDVELRVIGGEELTDGRYAARVREYIRRHRLEESVHLLGFLDHDQCLEEMRAADVFLHPSIVDDDGLSEGGAPTTILEAQAVGLPVVSTLHCDIPNVTLPGESAVLVPERDAAALAAALRPLLDDPMRRREMGAAGRRFVAEHHDIEREVIALEDHYLRLLAESRP